MRHTIAVLKEIGIDFGGAAALHRQAVLRDRQTEIPGKVLRAYTGTRLVFGA